MHPYVVILGRNISTYGIMAMIGIAFVVGYSFIVDHKDRNRYWDKVLFLIYAFFFSLIGGALLYILTTLKSNITAISLMFSDFEKAKQYFTFGIVFYGGMIGIFIGFMMYSKIFGEDVREWVRITVPSIPLFHIFGRIGCALGGCCYGIEVTKGGIYNALIDKYCLPIQLYESFGDLIIFIVLLIVSLRQKDKSRYYLPMGLYFILYGILRFVLEFWRGDRIRGIWGAFSTSQYISMIIVPIGIYCLVCPTEKNFFEKMYSAPKKIKSGNAQSVQQ